MELEDIWEKIANNARLTREELSFLKQSARETQLRNSFVAGNTTAQNTLALNLPVNVIYSQTLHKSLSSLTIDLPPDYNHLMIFSSGRVDAPNTDPPYAIKVRFNGSSTDYSYQFIRALDTTLSGAQSTETFGYLGMFLSGVAADGDMSNISFIANYRGAFNKTIHTFIGSGERVDFFTSVWDNTSAITRMEIFAATTLSIGSSFSVVGIK